MGCVEAMAAQHYRGEENMALSLRSWGLGFQGTRNCKTPQHWSEKERGEPCGANEEGGEGSWIMFLLVPNFSIMFSLIPYSNAI